MGLVTNTLLDIIRKQIDTSGTVVWYDAEQDYQDVAQSLTPNTAAGAEVRCYDPERGFLQLRRELEPLWGGRTPPRLLLYVPLSQAETQHALIEFEIGGMVMAPGQQPPACSTALSHIARQALGAVFPPAALEDIIAQTEAGQLSLPALNRLAEKGVEAQTGVIADIFGTGNVSEVALRFLSEPELDAKIGDRQASDNLVSILSEALGVGLAAGQGLPGLRVQVARQLLVTELIDALGDDIPPQLQTFPMASRPVARQTAVELAEKWRNSRNLSQSYVHWAAQIQSEIGLGLMPLDIGSLADTETFLLTEIRLQSEIESALAQRASTALLEIVNDRLTGFWSSQNPEIKTRWEVIASAGWVLDKATSAEKALKGRSWSAASLLSNYTFGDEPWCVLDTAQRHLERDFHRFECDPQQHASLLQLVNKARQRYTAVSDTLADRFTHAYETDQFEMPNVLLQSEVFQEVVAPALKNERTAYILVDALRYEMGRELCDLLEEMWHTDLVPALATPPTITEIGMAALLPEAEQGLSVVYETDKLGVVINKRTVKSRQDRLAYLTDVVKGNVVTTRLDQLAPLSDTQLSQSLKSADMIVVTATEEIDGLCENSPTSARYMFDYVLNQLRRGIKTLVGLGCQTVVIAADHGHLFGEKLSAGQAIDAPGGKTAILKRRVWVGKGGADSPSFLRASLADFGIGGDLELATPWNLSCFKVQGGSTEYFHGGLSLQEIVIPVLTVRPKEALGPETQPRTHWTLTLGSSTISTRFLSTTVEGESEELLPLQPPLVRVEVRAEDQPISVPVSASYGFQENTKDVQLQLDVDQPRSVAKNTVTLMITETPDVDDVTVHLLDATTGVSLARKDHVPFAIVI